MKQTQSIFLLIFLMFSFQAISQQNVGVNKSNPAQALDVNGNVNVDGNLMLNGQAGQAGQVLKTNSSGATQWVDFSQFQHVYQSYREVSLGVGLRLPINTTRVGIELQGAGGAGASTGGGAGGNYIAFIVEGLVNRVITYTVGAGGTYNGTTTGTSSTVTIDGYTYTAEGGYGANSIYQRGGYNNSVEGSHYFILEIGQPGTANDYNYTYGPGGNTLYKIIYGSGGGTYPSYTYTPGGTYIKNQTTGVDLHITESTPPFTFGSGGAANKVVNTLCNGRKGYLRIYY